MENSINRGVLLVICNSSEEEKRVERVVEE
jgi:hypothetical protein